ncbi:TRAP transporter substrate-binding protein DctP [Brevibacterium sp. UBA7493]|uniref:TRAP transporter substrate-binding protein DctP n=1 Tax=Brevibacterium sp. UBA7493 TaxID=1946121 RepID=UPI00257B0152|nr:TRAP transporter substrate-binding protein DctP [Brevibacterium sp. UBA7493]
MKKISIQATAIVCAGVLLALTGCSGDGNGAATTLRVAGQNNPDHPNTTELKTMAETVEKATDGRVKLEIYPNNQLGDYTLMYEEISRGSVDMGLISTPTHLDNRLEIQYLPYLFTTYDDVNENFTIDSVLGEKLGEIHEQQGITLLGLFAEGFGGIGSGKPVNDPANPGTSKGVRCRVPDITITATNTKDLGFQTVSLPYAEVYQGMQTGNVEAWTGGHPLVNYLQFRDVINYYYQYNNNFESTHLLINSDALNSLSEDDQNVLREAGVTLTENSYRLAEQQDEEYRKKMAESGIEVTEFSQDELERLAEYSREKSWSVLDDPKQKEMIAEVAKSLNIQL